MKLVDNGVALRQPMIHTHNTSAVPLGADYMAQQSTDQNQSRVTIRETAHRTGAMNLTTQQFIYIIGKNVSPVYTEKIEES